jgi:carbohydrate kinase (thermoresistant glucokinase family)
MSTAPILVVMGVAGAGKTTVGELIAHELDWPFVDGDDLHPKANIDKMRGGTPLTDSDRAPWLAAIGAWIDARAAAGQPGVVACSALKRAYRDTLRAGRPQVRIVYLRGSQDQIAERLAHRSGHFWPPELLASQFADLQEPGPDEDPIVVDIAEAPEAAAKAVITKLPQ